jgi:YVTN family beta-propeller protein
MKMILCKPILALAFALFTNSILFAQNNQAPIHEHEQCGTQRWLEMQFSANPSLRLQYEQMEKKMGDAATKKLQTANAGSYGPTSISSLVNELAVVTIPIVFHIVHTDPSIITNAQILALVDTMNKDFGGLNADSVEILAGFKPVFGKGNIRFCLAQRTPTGAVTNGIMRYTSSTVSDFTSNIDPIKSTAAGGADAWNPNQYINVWVGTFSNSGLLGYASFPITSPENPSGLLSQQGLVIEKGSVPGGTLQNYNSGRLLSHEIGHFFWLRHIWGDDYCGNDFPNTPGIDDTPTVSGPSSGCGTGIVATGCAGSSPNGRMYQNYMDYTYTNCMRMFSAGQALRMSICLDSFRASLKTSNGCQAVSCPTFNIDVNSTSATSVQINVTGGQAPYSFSLDSVNFQTSNQFSGLVAGNTYTVYVRDALFCRGRKLFNINNVNISTLPSNSFCVNQTLPVAYTTIGIFNTGNIFTVQLSNALGSFSNPLNIGSVVSTNSGTINCLIPDTLTPSNQYRIRIIATQPSITGSIYGTNIEINSTTVVPSVSIAVTAGNNPGCLGSSISFTATEVNGGYAPLFQWKKNGSIVDIGRVYTTTSLANNDVITCSMTSNSNCATGTSATSNAITLSLSASVVPSVSITANRTDTICAGASVIFTATSINGGTTPNYQWRKNGLIVGNNTQTYSTTNLNTGDTIICQLNSNLQCVNPNYSISNKITFQVLPVSTPTISISSSLGNVICLGTSVTFNATTTNAVNLSSFQWKKNGMNVGNGSSVYTTNSLMHNDSIICILNTNNPCLNLASVVSNQIIMNIPTVTTPTVSGSTTINCGQSIVLSATPTTTGNIINRYTTPTGGFPLATGNAFTVTPTNTTTYYAAASANNENGRIVTSISTTGGAVVDHNMLSGDDNAGIALSPNNVYYTGDDYTVRFNKDLTNGISLPRRQGFFSDLGNGRLWQIGNELSNGASFIGTATRIYELTDLLIPTGNYINLSQQIDLNLSSTFVASGSGFVIFYSSTLFYKVNLSDGTVTIFTNPSFFLFTSSDDWASYGWAEYDGTNYSICYVSSYNTISKIDISTGIVTVLQNFTNLSDMAAIIFDPYTDRMYFHHEGISQFGGEQETLGYTNLTSIQLNPICGSARVPITVTVNQSITTPAVNITSNYSGVICFGTNVTFTAFAQNEGTNPVFQWFKNGTLVYTGPTYSTVELQNSDTIKCVLTSSLLCVTTPTATSNNAIVSIFNPSVFPSVEITSSSSNPVCGGTNIVFTAATTNVGASAVYIWKKNGVQVGTNSSTFSDTANTNYEITCEVKTSTPCATTVISNTIQMDVITRLQPSISISNNAGNLICVGKTVTFYSFLVNQGTAPTLQWKKNSQIVGSGTTFTTSNLANNDTIICFLSSSLNCLTQTTVASNPIIFTVSPIPTINSIANQTICPGSTFPSYNFSGTGFQYNWTNSNTAIGLAASGSGSSLPSFVATNTSTNPLTATIHVTPVSASASRAFITNINNNNVSVVNLNTNAIETEITVGFIPWAVAVSPNGDRVYVASVGNYPGAVSVINTSNNQVIATYSTTNTVTPYRICLSPDGSKLYISNFGSDIIEIVNTNDMSTVASLNVYDNPLGIATSPDGQFVYVVTSAYLIIFNSTGDFINSIFIGPGTTDIAVSPDGSKVYLTNMENNYVSIYNTTTLDPITTIATGQSPNGITLSPDGTKLYVTNNLSNTVSVINTLTNQLSTNIPVGLYPSGISISADGIYVYVTNQNDHTVSVIDTRENIVTTSISGFSGPPLSFGNFINNRPGCSGPPTTFNINVTIPNAITWLGAISTDWRTPANWSCERIPTILDNVVIGSSANNFYPIILTGDSIRIKSLKVLTGTKVTVNTGASVILSGPPN